VTDPPLTIVVSDANVMINLIHVARLDLCARLPGLEFVVPDHVRDEITGANQRSMLDRAVAEGHLSIASITDPDGIALFAELTRRLGRGESACLVLAVKEGWTVASDEKRRFRREAANLVGNDRIIGTPDIYMAAIRAGLLTIDEADADKEELEKQRFKMPFGSFREVIGSASRR
jgi:predicted nucleic acid-binding protein